MVPTKIPVSYEDISSSPYVRNKSHGVTWLGGVNASDVMNSQCVSKVERNRAEF
jgi:hypothetical protein